MSVYMPPSWVLFCALIPLGIYLYTGSRRRLPPGPPGLPLIGNLFDLPDKEDPIPWAAHREKYGPISSVTVLGQHIILLNDLRTNIDLLDKRSSIYAGRPFFPFASGMVGWDQQLIMAQPGEHFRAMRKLLKSYVGTPATAASFQHVQETETRHFLLRVMRKPDDLIAQLRIAAGSIALQISHGYQVETEKPDILVSLVENAAKDFFHATMPGRWFIDIFPQMGRLPKWFNFHKVAAEYRKRNLEQSDRPYNFVKQQMVLGTAQPSFTSLALNDTTDPQTLYATKFAATAIYGGGSDPAVGALSAFILALVAFPQCQKRAQKEIDDVVGTKRLPNFSDRPNLPYIEAMMKETVRWQCTGRIGIPHRATEDDSYGGYDIPKDSLILPHMWNITHDPMLYSSPSEFRPERFLGDNPELDPATYLFGFGRRACPGEDLAKAHMFITMAMILAAFNIRRPWNEHREEIAPACEFLPGTVSHPRPFGYVLEVRSDEVTALIESIEDEAPQRPSDGDSV